VDIFTKLPEPLSMAEAGPRTFVVKGEHMDSLATVLGQVRWWAQCLRGRGWVTARRHPARWAPLEQRAGGGSRGACDKPCTASSLAAWCGCGRRWSGSTSCYPSWARRSWTYSAPFVARSCCLMSWTSAFIFLALLCVCRVVVPDVAPLSFTVSLGWCWFPSPRMYTCLLNNQVPKNWEAAAYPSLKPLASWVKDFHARISFMRDWLQHGQPTVFWMSGFFFPQVRQCVLPWAPSLVDPRGLAVPSLPFAPRQRSSICDPAVAWSAVYQGFTTGTLQNHARKYGVAIDALSFGFRVMRSYSAEEMKEEEDVPEDGVLVHGLFMDGARWDRDAQLLGEHILLYPRGCGCPSCLPSHLFLAPVSTHEGAPGTPPTPAVCLCSNLQVTCDPERCSVWCPSSTSGL
jgi:hypothetical protein